MKTIEMAEATQSLATYARKAGKETTVVTQNGKPIAAVLKLSNTDWETIALSTHPAFMRVIRNSRKSYRKNRGMSSAEVKRKFAK
jgi:hypothetical protein